MTQAILLIRGLPGSGKSTIARALAAATGAVVEPVRRPIQPTNGR